MVAAVWFATCSPRLSYVGVQVAVAFCLINLREFRIQTSLAVARDRVAGITWLINDVAGIRPALEFAGRCRDEESVRLGVAVAQFSGEPGSSDTRVAIERRDAFREIINVQFDKVRSLADAVLFKFGSSRPRDLYLRDHIGRWQPQLRTFFRNV
jgi:multidrug resistance protein MdtO